MGLHVHTLFCSVTHKAKYFSCKILKHVQYHNSGTRNLWKRETWSIYDVQHMHNDKKAGCTNHFMTKWLATLSFKKASSSSPQIMGLSCTQTILFQYSLVQLYSNFFRSYMTCSIMAKKDVGIQPRFEPGSSEFRSDALTN